MRNIGFIGTGGMGSGMAANLIKAGFKLVVNDLRREVTRPLEEQGAEVKATPSEVAESTEVVLSMLPYSAAVKEGPGPRPYDFRCSGSPVHLPVVWGSVAY